MRTPKIVSRSSVRPAPTSPYSPNISPSVSYTHLYPSFLTDIVDLRRSSLVGSIGYHHIPGHCPLLGGWSMGISAVSRHKQEAFEFLKWTCDEQVANYLTLLGGQSAITSTYTNDELVKLYPWLPLYLSLIHI